MNTFEWFRPVIWCARLFAQPYLDSELPDKWQSGKLSRSYHEKRTSTK